MHKLCSLTFSKQFILGYRPSIFIELFQLSACNPDDAFMYVICVVHYILMAFVPGEHPINYTREMLKFAERSIGKHTAVTQPRRRL